MPKHGALLLIAAGLAAPASSWAGVWLQTALTATSDTSDNGSGTLQTSDTRIVDSSSVGYAFPQGFILGAQFLYSRTSLTGDNAFAWGPKGGLLLKGFELSTAYLPWATLSSGGSSFSGGGFTINAGYTFHVLGPLRLGLQVLYWALTFNEQNGQSLIPHTHLSRISPQVALGFEF